MLDVLRWWLDHLRVWPLFLILGTVAAVLAEVYAQTKAGL